MTVVPIRPSAYRRNVAALGLVAYAVLSVASVALQPPLGGGPGDRLAAIAAAGPSAVVSAVAFVLSQLPLVVGLLGIAHLMRATAPRWATTAATIGVVGAFGHAVAGAVLLTEVMMAGDAGHRDVYAAFVSDLNESPVMVFSLLGLVGTVVGLLLAGVALWRARLVSRWVPITLWVFLVVEFAGTAVTERAAYLSGLCLVAAFGALAVTVWRSPRSAWAATVVDRAHEAPVAA